MGGLDRRVQRVRDRNGLPGADGAEKLPANLPTMISASTSTVRVDVRMLIFRPDQDR